MSALVIGIFLALLYAGGATGVPDSIDAPDTNHATQRNVRDLGTQGLSRAATAESSLSVFTLNFPDGSTEEISARALTAYLRRNPCCRPAVLCALLFSSPLLSQRHNSPTGLSVMLLRGPLRLTAFERMAMAARRYQEYFINPALRKPSAQMNLLEYVAWLVLRM